MVRCIGTGNNIWFGLKVRGKVGIMNKISYLYLWIKHRVFKSIQ